MNRYEDTSKKLLLYVENKLIGDYLVKNTQFTDRQTYPLGVALIDLFTSFMVLKLPILLTTPAFSYKLSIFAASTKKDMLLAPYLLLIFLIILHICLFIYQSKHTILFKGKVNFLAIIGALLILLFKSTFRYIAIFSFVLSSFFYFLFYFYLRKSVE